MKTKRNRFEYLEQAKNKITIRYQLKGKNQGSCIDVKEFESVEQANIAYNLLSNLYRNQ